MNMLNYVINESILIDFAVTQAVSPSIDPMLPAASITTPFTHLDVGFVKEIHEKGFMCQGISLDEAVQTICNYTEMCVCDLTSPLETVCSCLRSVKHYFHSGAACLHQL